MPIKKCGGEVVAKNCALIAYRIVLAFKKLPRLLDIHSREQTLCISNPRNIRLRFCAALGAYNWIVDYNQQRIDHHGGRSSRGSNQVALAFEWSSSHQACSNGADVDWA